MSRRLPIWFKQRPPDPKTMSKMRRLLGSLSLHTICQSALCPNIAACFCQKRATFLILGDICTRDCSFCAMNKGFPSAIDEKEPQHLLEAVRRLSLSYVVVTSVTRDDLSDGGASHFATTIDLLRSNRSSVIVECLIPDFLGSDRALRAVVAARPQVISHNIETVPRLYPEVRPSANYSRSLKLLSGVKNLDPQIVTKSGLMLGLGETKDEVIGVMSKLRDTGCDLLTLGQYLKPSPKHHPVVRFVHPEEFSEYKRIGRDMGFAAVASAPLVRSSYEAAELYDKATT